MDSPYRKSLGLPLYSVGMQVERILDSKWLPAAIGRVYGSDCGSMTVDLQYAGLEGETEEYGVSVAFIRPARERPRVIIMQDLPEKKPWRVSHSYSSSLTKYLILFR